MEEEGQDAVEVGPQANAAEDAQDEAEEGIGHLSNLSTQRPDLGENYKLYISRSTFIEAVEW